MIPASLLAAAGSPRISTLAGTCIPPAWTFDLAAIERACDELGVTRPVRIYTAQYRPRVRTRTYGIHTWAGAEHRIGLARWQSARQASATLWHELMHAHQLERDGEQRFYAGPRLRTGSWEYVHDAYEVEARAAEPRAETSPLVIE